MTSVFNPLALFEGRWARVPDCLWYSDEDLSVRVVFGQLIREARGKHYCWPFMKTIAAKLFLSEKTVERAIERLEELELIRVERPKDREDWSGRDQAEVETSGNRYFFNDPAWIVPYLDKEAPGPHPKKPEKVQQRDRLGDGQRQTRRRSATDSETVSDRLGDGHSLIKEIRDITKGEREMTAPASQAVVLDRSRSEEREASLPLTPRPELEIKFPPTDEPNEVGFAPKPKSSPGPLNASPTSFDLDAAIERGKAKTRLESLASVGQRAIDRANEARANKAAKKERRKQEKAAYEKLNNESFSSEVETEAYDPKSNPKGYIAKVWFGELANTFAKERRPKSFIAREWGIVQSLLDNNELDHVEDAVVYLIRNWTALGKRFFKEPDPIPTVGTLYALQQKLIPEAGLWTKYRAVLEEYEAFGDEYAERPYDLQARYDEARKALSGLKLSKVNR